MSQQNTIIMSWSKCKIEIGKTGSDDAMASSLASVGVINDKSTTLATNDGDKLQAKATGGIVVAEEEGEHEYIITTRVKEMDFATEASLNGGTVNAGGELVVKTNIISDFYSVKVTPKNIGAIGIKARKCHVTMKPGSSEEEGHYVDLTFKIMACADGELYRKFRVAAGDWQSGSGSSAS